MSQSATTSSPTELRELLARQERRIVELEIDAAFHRQTTETLDEVIRELGDRVSSLQRQLAQLGGQLAQLAPGGALEG